MSNQVQYMLRLCLLSKQAFYRSSPTPKACLGLPKRPSSEDHWEEDDFTPVSAIIVLLHRLKIFCSIFTMTKPIDPLQDWTLNPTSPLYMKSIMAKLQHSRFRNLSKPGAIMAVSTGSGHLPKWKRWQTC